MFSRKISCRAKNRHDSVSSKITHLFIHPQQRQQQQNLCRPEYRMLPNSHFNLHTKSPICTDNRPTWPSTTNSRAFRYLLLYSQHYEPTTNGNIRYYLWRSTVYMPLWVVLGACELFTNRAIHHHPPSNVPRMYDTPTHAHSPINLFIWFLLILSCTWHAIPCNLRRPRHTSTSTTPWPGPPN